SAAAEEREKVHVFTHLSHLYPTGSSVYTSYVFRPSETAEKTLSRWQAMKTAASRAIVETGGTISHQHGVGTDHAPYLAAEKSAPGMEILRAVADAMDPEHRMNPGKLIEP
ncbi:MAG: FAD-linked oxidase C-terminal domain-containing protein, partial [Thermodesulfobacteriota bacterium]